MPSGAKRRKAAKKRREKEANNNDNASLATSDNSSHAHDDPNSQIERDRDGGEVGTFASQDQQNHNRPFSEGDQEGYRRDASLVPSFVTENRPMEEVPKNEESTEILKQEDDVAVEIVRQLKPDADLDGIDVSIEHVEHDGSSSSSSSGSSSSDDESQDSEKKLEETCDSIAEPTVNSDKGNLANSFHEEVVQVTANVSSGVGEADSVSASETAFVSDVVKRVLSMPEEVNPSIENASLNNSMVSCAVGRTDASLVPSFVTENRPMEEVLKNEESTEILKHEDDVVVEIERLLKPDADLESRDVSIEHVEHDSSSSSGSSDDESRDSEKKLEETRDSIAEPTVNSDDGNPVNSLREEAVQVTENVSSGVGEADSVSTAETAFVGEVVKPVLSMHEEVNPSIENASLNNSVVSTAVELGMKENEDKLFPINNGVHGAQSYGNREKMLPPSNGLTAETGNVAENTHDSKIPGYTEKQPLVTPTLPVVRRTSCLGCCGLFEVLSGSGR